jgi:hypothetical protein
MTYRLSQNRSSGHCGADAQDFLRQAHHYGVQTQAAALGLEAQSLPCARSFTRQHSRAASGGYQTDHRDPVILRQNAD